MANVPQISTFFYPFVEDRFKTVSFEKNENAANNDVQ